MSERCECFFMLIGFFFIGHIRGFAHLTTLPCMGSSSTAVATSVVIIQQVLFRLNCTCVWDHYLIFSSTPPHSVAF